MTQRKPDTYERSYRSVLYYVLSFGSARCYIQQDKPYPHVSGSTESWYPEQVWIAPGETFWGNGRAQVGDLIKLTSIREGHNEWLLSWLIGVDDTHTEAGHGRRYLCRSLMTGNECWWENVGVEYFDREKVSANTKWRWSDAQWALWFRWSKLCDKMYGDFRYPLHPTYGEDGSITVSIRTRYGLSDYHPNRTFPDWRKFTLKEMRRVRKELEEDAEADMERVKQEREKNEAV